MTQGERASYVVRIEGAGTAEAEVYELVAAALVALRSRLEQEAPALDEQTMQDKTDEHRWRFADRPNARKDWRHSLR